MIGWVRVDAAIGDDPKIGLIAEALGCDEPKAIGHLVLLWAKMANHARDGRLAQHSDPTLERWAAWVGRRGRFAAAVRSHLCSDNGTMRAWERHNGAPMRKAEADAERLRIARAGSADVGATPGPAVAATPGATNGNVGATVAPTVAASVAPAVEGTDVRTNVRSTVSSNKRDRARAAGGADRAAVGRPAATSDPVPITSVPAPEVSPEKAAEIEAKRQAYLARAGRATTTEAPHV